LIADSQRADLDRYLTVDLRIGQLRRGNPLGYGDLAGELVVLDADVIDQTDHVAGPLLSLRLAE
jgi:hypothetical protein